MLTLHPDKCTHMEIGKNNVGENQYYTTMNNVTKTIDTHDKQKDLGVTFDSKLTFDLDAPCPLLANPGTEEG